MTHHSAVILIRAHDLGEHTSTILRHIRSRTRCPAKILLHNRGPALPHSEDVIQFDEAAVNRLGISTFGRSDWAWFMGDYPLYVVFDRYAGYDYALMMEYDVKANFDIDAFLCDAADIDFVAQYAGFDDPTWEWYRAAALWFAAPKGSFFPLVSVSRQLAEAALHKRREISRSWIESGSPDNVLDYMVDCEALLPSVCAERGYRTAEIGQILPGWDHAFFTGFGLFPWEAPHLNGVAALHPCLPRDALPRYYQTAMDSPHIAQGAKDRLRSDLDKLIAVGFVSDTSEIAGPRPASANRIRRGQHALTSPAPAAQPRRIRMGLKGKFSLMTLLAFGLGLRLGLGARRSFSIMQDRRSPNMSSQSRR